MGMRSTGSTSISFGLVSVPVKLYTATSEKNPKFSNLHTECGGRVKQKIICPVCDVDVDGEHTCKGYEVGKDPYVTFTAEELVAMKPDQFSHLAIEEFVPEDSIDPVYFQKTIYIGPDKFGQRAFNLLSKAMTASGRVAIGQYMMRNKVYICALRPYKTGLVMHHLWYGDEVRDFGEVPNGEDCMFEAKEEKLGMDLIKSLSAKTFDPNKYSDTYRSNVAAAVEAKQNGKEVAVAPTASQQPQVVDLFEALKMSLDEEKAKKKNKKKAG